MPSAAPSWPRRWTSIAALPAVMTLLVPALLLRRWPFRPWAGWAALRVLGSLLLGSVGLWLAVSTIRLFHSRGRGTLAPWDPTRKLVVEGPYRFVRNPMISGVLLILLAEACLAASWALLVWAGLFWVVNAVYIPLVEERGLRGRFGPAYRIYAEAVPRWVPRPRPWSPE